MTVEPDTDGTLIERSARGRPDTFVEVARRHELAVHAFLARRAGPQVAADPWDEVVHRLDSVGQARALAAAIRALPPAERDVLLLVAWEQLTPAQAARALGIPLGTARSRLHRARAVLHLVLTEENA